jgi:ubiquinone/menaquinone biosynthesis C-methylase UbiE
MGKYWAEIADTNSTQNQLLFLKDTLKTNGLILDLACGTARHSTALTKEGYTTVGIDVSPQLLKIAKKTSQIPLVRGDIRYLPFRSNV